jgi:hypothetical protein
LHCGHCDERCNRREICVDGDCEDWEPARGCNACPCDVCDGELDRCCAYPGNPDVPICTNEDCP